VWPYAEGRKSQVERFDGDLVNCSHGADRQNENACMLLELSLHFRFSARGNSDTFACCLFNMLAHKKIELWESKAFTIPKTEPIAQ